MLLALEQHRGHYTLGREIDPQRVEEIEAIGRKHGVGLAEIRSFGHAVPAAHFERLAAINARRAPLLSPEPPTALPLSPVEIGPPNVGADAILI
jgi:hypothetical protein